MVTTSDYANGPIEGLETREPTMEGGLDEATATSASSPLVSVLILNFNGLRHLEACVESVTKTKHRPLEIIVVDNGSTDGSPAHMRQKHPSVKMVELGRNTGTSVGYMEGVHRASGDYVAILSNDMEVEPTWLDHLIGAIEGDDALAAAEPKYKNYYRRDRFDDVAAAGRWIDRYGNNYTRGVNEIDRGQYDAEEYVMGTVTFFRRRTLVDLGGFDPFYFWGYEDIDLGWRIYAHGMKVLYVPKAVIYHKSGVTTRTTPERRLNPHLYYLSKRNRLITLVKNYSYRSLPRALSVTSMEYLGTAAYFLYKGKPAYSESLLKALVFVPANFGTILGLRQRAQSTKTLEDSEVMKFMKPYAGDVLKFAGSRGSP